MARCFVIQPFDKGPFDKRYDDVLVPAIVKAGIKPYRVDRDPSVLVPIETIEQSIRESEYCLAEITLDNPNVWYEVGYAFARDKDVVLVCSQERTVFPFDVRHRSVITYTTHSTRDFEKLSQDITARLRALTRKTKAITELTPIKPTEGLLPHEIAALVLLVQERVTPSSCLYPHVLQQNILRAGYTKVATALALESLRIKGLIDLRLILDQDDEKAEVYGLTDEGVRWCMSNLGMFQLTCDPPPTRVRRPLPQPESDVDDDNIPF
jgi:hypothetical protein